MYLTSADSGGTGMATTTMIHVRVDETVKAQAAATLADMGLSVSDAVRMLLVRVAAERALPFDVRVPNAETAAAIRELEAGQGTHLESIDALMADLNADD
jgi:DNA-damage-inducible protein J